MRYVERTSVKRATARPKKIISVILTNRLIRAIANCVTNMMGHKKKENKSGKKPYWWRKIIEKQAKLRKGLGQVNKINRGELTNEGIKSVLERRYCIVEKGREVVDEEAQQKLIATGENLDRYDNRIKQYTQNRLLEFNQKKLFDQLERKIK